MIENIINLIKKIIFEWKIPYFWVFKKYLSYISFVSLIVLFFPETAEDFGSLWWWLLLVLLFSRPISHILPKLGILKKLVALRKELWIICGCFIIAHGSGYAIDDIGIIDEIQKDLLNFKSFLFWGFWWWVITIPLLITSNNFSMKILWKYWKKLHKLAYLLFVFAAIHIDLVEGEVWNTILILLHWVIWMMAYKKVILWK
jgi:sulfoxide reductase heme-binding subunit YedZ